MNIKYGVKKGLSIVGDVQQVGEELTLIENKTPISVIEYAEKNKDSALYKQFEWDNSIAGEKYRLVQARQLMNHILIREIDEEEVECRAYSNITIEEEEVKSNRIYGNTIEVLKDDDQRKNLINNIKKLHIQASNAMDAYNNCITLLHNKKLF